LEKLQHNDYEIWIMHLSSICPNVCWKYPHSASTSAASKTRCECWDVNAVNKWRHCDVNFLSSGSFHVKSTQSQNFPISDFVRSLWYNCKCCKKNKKDITIFFGQAVLKIPVVEFWPKCVNLRRSNVGISGSIAPRKMILGSF